MDYILNIFSIALSLYQVLHKGVIHFLKRVRNTPQRSVHIKKNAPTTNTTIIAKNSIIINYYNNQEMNQMLGGGRR